MHLAHVLLNDVEVVEQPLSCWTDIGSAGRCGRQSLVSALEDAARRVEALQEASRTWSAANDDALRPRDCPCALREVLGAEELPPDWTGEQIVRTLRRAANAEPARK